MQLQNGLFMRNFDYINEPVQVGAILIQLRLLISENMANEK